MNSFIMLVHWVQHYYIVVMTVLFVVIVAATFAPNRKAAIEQQGRRALGDDV